MSLPYSCQLAMVLPMLVIGLVGGEPQEFRDQIVVRGDRLRGEVVGIEDGMVRFRVVYGEGELLIPVLINPSYNAQDDLIGVFSIRARVVL